jgi:hypothetical protein
MTTIPTRLRQREILDAQLTQCRQVDSSFARGAVAGLRWLTEGGPGPLSGALATSIAFRGIVNELAAAEAIIYGPPSTGRDYARGVEHALLWAESATSGPPVPAPSRSRTGDRGRVAAGGPPSVGRSPHGGDRSHRHEDAARPGASVGHRRQAG